MPDRDNQVQVKWPIVITVGRKQNTVNIGTLHVVASVTSPRIHERIADLSLRLMDLEPQIHLIIGELERQHAAPADVRVTGVVPAPRYAGTERRAEPAPLVPSRH